MKSICFFGLMLIAGVLAQKEQGLTKEQKEVITHQLIGMAIECYQEYPITVFDVYVFKQKKVRDDTNAKCFTNCMFKKTGVMDEHGMVSPDLAQKYAEPIFKDDEAHLRNTAAIMKLCSAVNEIETKDGDKGCDRAKLAYECLLENAPKYGFDLEM